jgi:hypothetical protein
MMTTTAMVNVQMGTAFWLMMAAVIGILVLWSVLGSERMAEVVRGSLKDSFGR